MSGPASRFPARLAESGSPVSSFDKKPETCLSSRLYSSASARSRCRHFSRGVHELPRVDSTEQLIPLHSPPWPNVSTGREPEPLILWTHPVAHFANARPSFPREKLPFAFIASLTENMAGFLLLLRPFSRIESEFGRAAFGTPLSDDEFSAINPIATENAARDASRRAPPGMAKSCHSFGPQPGPEKINHHTS